MQYMPLEFILQDYPPGSSGEPGWSWLDEAADLLSRDRLDMSEMYDSGPILEPILLEEEGTVLDGHHRVVVAALRGDSVIPVRFL